MINEKEWEEFKIFSKDCREKHIPVIRDDSAKLLCEYVQKYQPKKILEIGTAVGYSGTLMLLSSQNSELVTIDVNKDMCNEAIKTFERYGIYDRCKVINADAIDFLAQTDEVFDFIFIDGPKGQYIKYYQFLKKITKSKSVVFCDDVLYYGMIDDDSKVIHKKITIVRNLREFLEVSQHDEDFTSELIRIDDGILVLIRK